MADCPLAGDYRAPKSRDALTDYWWFCLDHVRAYNAAWDFYKGMSPGEIEAQVRADTSWQRPTWPLGSLGAHTVEDLLRDPLRALHGGIPGSRRAEREREAEQTPPDLREPLATLGLAWPLTLDALKRRYKALAKQHHPDANGGDRAAEERLKTINLAYAALRGRLTRAPQAATA